METFTLSKSVNSGGAEYSELNLDCDKITGATCIEAQAIISSSGGFMVVPESDKRYLAILTARACGVDREVINLLSAKDFATITTAVGNFLLA